MRKETMAAGRNSPRRGWTEQHPSRRRRLWAAAAAGGTVVAQMGRRSVAELASPALAVKAGRNRGPSVLERQQNDANERQQEAAAAKATLTARKPKRVESAERKECGRFKEKVLSSDNSGDQTRPKNTNTGAPVKEYKRTMHDHLTRNTVYNFITILWDPVTRTVTRTGVGAYVFYTGGQYV